MTGTLRLVGLTSCAVIVVCATHIISGPLSPLHKKNARGRGDNLHAPKPPDDDGPWPIRLTKQIGPVFRTNDHRLVTTEVLFQNPSPTVPLELRVVGKTCTCMPVEVTPPVVPPGERATIKLGTRLSGVEGEQRIFARLANKRNDREEVQITVKIRSVVPLRIEPSSMPVVEVPPDGVRDVLLSVTTSVPDDDSFTDLVIDADQQGVEFDVRAEHFRATDGVRTRETNVIAHIDGHLARQTSQRTVTISATHGEDRAKMYLQWKTREDISVVPDSLFVDLPRHGITSKRVYLLAEAPMRVTGCECDLMGVSFQWDRTAVQKRIPVTIHFPGSPALPRRSVATISFATTSNATKHIALPVRVLNRASTVKLAGRLGLESNEP